VRAGDVLRVDFGVPIGSSPGFQRPAVVVTADAVLRPGQPTFHVVPITSNVEREYRSDVSVDAAGLSAPSVAQCHLLAVVAAEQVLDEDLGNVGAVALAQIRSVIADLLDIE
jgi:mRNA-degrading endonuclease toxin of MazEF toxin-antitoxin module